FAARPSSDLLGIPELTATVDRGGGFWAFCRLSANIQPPAAERLGRALEWKSSADHCHNVDRIARLPGTVNHPNKAKREAGRVAADAKLLVADWSRSYSPGVFEALANEFEAKDKAKTASVASRAKEDRKSTRLNSSHVSISYA